MSDPRLEYSSDPDRGWFIAATIAGIIATAVAILAAVTW